MALSLGFHILFAVAGIAMPALMVAAEGRWLRSRHPADLELAKRWARGTAVLFAVGAVSGTVLSFELGLLWPRFMAFAGPIIGMPFSLEGAAFFLEAIFLGIYLYGWEKVPARAHWLSGLGILASGALSGIFVVTANAWMNTPAGFRLEGGRPVDIHPWAAMWNPAAPAEALHMTLAAFLSVGFVVAAIHAFQLLRRPSEFHRRAYLTALSVGAAAALLQPLSGDFSARAVARDQPLKLAAMEGLRETRRGAPLRFAGLEIPKGLSLLAYRDPDAEVLGLNAVKPEDRPPSEAVHCAFQVMVACGMILFGVSALGVFLYFRRKTLLLDSRFLRLVMVCGPLGLIALEAGWTVTELGRQPWIIAHIARVSDSATPMPGIRWTFLIVVFVYLLLAVVVFKTLRSLMGESRRAP